jgi:hypothetical protein
MLDCFLAIEYDSCLGSLICVLLIIGHIQVLPNLTMCYLFLENDNIGI